MSWTLLGVQIWGAVGTKHYQRGALTVGASNFQLSDIYTKENFGKSSYVQKQVNK